MPKKGCAMSTPITLEQLQGIARLAGPIIMSYFKGFGMKREFKSDTTPLTQADLAVNRMTIEQIRMISSDVDIVGEEESQRTNSSWQIVIDPIDGTFPFTWGMPLSTFMIGLLYKNEPVMGVIYDPFLDRMYSAETGGGAFMNGMRLHVSDIAERQGKVAPVVGYVSWSGCEYNILKACQYLAV